jgi:hypothetical protein
MPATLCHLFTLAIIAAACTHGVVNAGGETETAINRSSCQVSFGDSSSARPISILQVVTADGLDPCADAVMATIDATLTCSAPALAEMNIWPMFVWKSHDNDSPKYVSLFDAASARSSASMSALGRGISMQLLRIPALFPPACCGVGMLQVSTNHAHIAQL